MSQTLHENLCQKRSYIYIKRFILYSKLQKFELAQLQRGRTFLKSIDVRFFNKTIFEITV